MQQSFKTREALQRNPRIYYFIDFFSGLEFNLPVWVAFELHFIPYSIMALVESFGYGVATILEIPTGALSDLIGRKTMLIFGFLIRAFSYFFIVWHPSPVNFFIYFGLSSLGSAFISGSDVAILYDSFKELGKEDAYGPYAAKGGSLHRLGLVVGSLFGGSLYVLHIGLPYIAVGLMMLVCMCLVLFMKEPDIDSEKFSLKNYINQTRTGFKEIVKNSFVRKLSLYYVLVAGITWSCLAYFNQPFANDNGYSPTQQSYLLAATYTVSSLLIILITRKKVLNRKIVYLGFPIILSLVLLPGIFVTKLFVPFIIVGVLFAGSSRFTFLDAYTNKEFTSKYRATALSALNMLVSVFIIILIGFSGKLQELYTTKFVFTMLGLVSLLILLPTALSLIKEHNKYYSNV